MYNEIYNLFIQKEKDFSQQIQQIKDNIYQVIYKTTNNKPVALCRDISYCNIVIK